MRTRTRIFIGLAITLLLITGGVWWFIQHELTKSFAPTSGSLPLHGLTAPVEVLRDEYGTPHIHAQNEHDLLLALGYVHAQDRLWQMDMARRLGLGRLSEVLGEKTVQFDRMFRIVGLRQVAEATEARLSPAFQERMEAYADGVNEYIRQHKGKYPVEFDMLGYEPELWRPLHTVLLGKVMAWEMNLSWWTDVTYGAIANRIGIERAMELYPDFPGTAIPQVSADVWKAYAGLEKGYLHTAQEFAETCGTASLLGGSNAWAVAPSRSEDGGVLLANDTHLQLQAPSQWYEVYLDAPGFSVGGMSIAGIPAIVAGRNGRIAWGITNAMADDADFFIEKVDSSDVNKYSYDGQWQQMTVHTEEIPVRGGESVPVTIRSTVHGPIVTDIQTMLQKVHPPFVASMRWTGADPDDQLEAFDQINRARTWQEFTAALKNYPGPGQNFVYGDVDGNIGYYCALKLPIREQKNTLFPQAGWTRDSEWKGYVPFEQLPHLFAPPDGYVASANNKLVDNSYPYHISDLWEPSSRILRLRYVLGNDSTGFTVDDFQRLQVDDFSTFAQDLLPLIINAAQDSSFTDSDKERIVEYLRNWNCRFAREDAATTIFQQFFVRLLYNTYADELGEDLFHDWVILSNVPVRVTQQLLRDGTSHWFDDVRTPEIETRDMIIRKSLQEAVLMLRAKCGNDMKTWRWGDVHTVTLRHPFGFVKPLDKVFNIGPYPAAGGTTAIVSGEFSFNDPFAVTVGPSFRQIFDMKTGEIRSVVPGGASGQVYHQHYRDQVEMWLNGVCRTETWGVPPRRAEKQILEPEP